MKREVVKKESSTVEVTVTVDEKSWKEAQEASFKKLAANVEIKGFRKGKAPENLVKEKVKEAEVYNEAINALLPKLYEEVITEEKLQPFARPSVNVSKLDKNELVVVFTIITAPEVTLGQYKGLGIKKKDVEVTDEEVEASVKKLLEGSAELLLKDSEAAMGDTVTIDFVGSIDGVEFEGGKGENYALELGSHSFVPGFEEQLVGKKSGDTVDVKVKFPEQYVENLAGKDATFKVVVHEVKEKKIPELTDDAVKELAIDKVTTVEELKAKQKSELLANKTQQVNNEQFDQILAAIREKSAIDIAKQIIDDEVAGMRKNVEQQIAQNGLTVEQYLKIVGKTEEDFTKQLEGDAEKNIRSLLVMEEIAKIENITVNDEDIEFEEAKIADQYKMDIAKVKEILEKDLPRFKSEIRRRRIEQFIISNNE